MLFIYYAIICNNIMSNPVEVTLNWFFSEIQRKNHWCKKYYPKAHYPLSELFILGMLTQNWNYLYASALLYKMIAIYIESKCRSSHRGVFILQQWNTVYSFIKSRWAVSPTSNVSIKRNWKFNNATCGFQRALKKLHSPVCRLKL